MMKLKSFALAAVLAFLAVTDVYAQCAGLVPAGTVCGNRGASSTLASPSRTPVLGLPGTAIGTLGLAGNTSGTVTISPQAAAGTYNFNLPTSAGTSGQPLLSGGGGASAMSFGSLSLSNTTGALPVAQGGTGFTTGAREKLTGARTYFVRTDGSNTLCNGQTNASSASAPACGYATPQKAVDEALALDFNQQTVTINVGNGTYTGGIDVFSTPPGLIINTQFVINGDTTTPANVIISTTSRSAVLSGNAVGGRGTVRIQGFELRTTTAGSGLEVFDGSNISFSSMRFGTIADAGIYTHTGGYAQAVGAYTVAGNSAQHVLVNARGAVFLHGQTITYANSPVFSSNFVVSQNGFMSIGSMSFINGGTVTGQRFSVALGGRISGASNNLTYIPGSTDGSIAFGGQYDDLVGQLPGTTTNDSASAGNVGQLISGSLASGSATSLADNTAKTITSMSLTAGQWRVCGAVIFNPTNASTNITALVSSISTTDNTLDQSSAKVFGVTRFGASGFVPGLNNNISLNAGLCSDVQLSGTTTYYLIGYSTFTVSTLTAWGDIWAIRTR